MHCRCYGNLGRCGNPISCRKAICVQDAILFHVRLDGWHVPGRAPHVLDPERMGCRHRWYPLAWIFRRSSRHFLENGHNICLDWRRYWCRCKHVGSQERWFQELRDQLRVLYVDRPAVMLCLGNFVPLLHDCLRRRYGNYHGKIRNAAEPRFLDAIARRLYENEMSSSTYGRSSAALRAKRQVKPKIAFHELNFNISCTLMIKTFNFTFFYIL